MILKRMADGIRTQNWFTVIVEIFIVVIGIFLGLQVTEWNEEREESARTKQVIETLREDLKSAITYEILFTDQIQNGLDAWQKSFEAGKRLPPYYFLTPGSDTPPANTWDALLNMRIGELVHPKLMFELAFYYSEREGVGRKYIRYVTFLEQEMLPRLKQDPSVFYTSDGSRLKPVFENSMDLLQSWKNESVNNAEWAKCLADNLEALAVSGETCVPALRFDDSEQAVFKNEAAQ